MGKLFSINSEGDHKEERLSDGSLKIYDPVLREDYRSIKKGTMFDYVIIDDVKNVMTVKFGSKVFQLRLEGFRETNL